MSKLILLTCLLVAALASNSYFLSPAYPPSAYQNEFYTTRFRVRGLDNPVFNFEGLPKTFKGSQDGVISGVPSQAGTFSVLIKYNQGSSSGENKVILKVLPNGKKIDNVVKSVQVNDGLIVQNSNNLIFVEGKPIKIQFAAKNGKGKLVWVFNGLPEGVNGDSSKGVIEGTISNAGYYNFHVECGDSRGSSAQVFLTINIQPKSTLQTTKIVDVPKQTSQSTFDLIEKEQVAADNELFKALENVNARKAVVADVKQHYAVATLRLQKAQASYDAADATYQQALNDKQLASNLLRSAQRSLDAAQKNLELALTEGAQAAAAVAEQRKKVDDAQRRFDDAQKALTKAIDAVNAAKQKLRKCEEQLRDAQNQKKAAQEQYKRAAQGLENAKKALENAKNRKQKADQAVRDAKDALELATLARDNAENNLKQADFNLERAEQQLKDALKKAADLRQKYNNASKDANAGEWDLELAINKLYVAQSRKQTADRASAIALADGSLSDHNGGNGFNTIGSTGSTSSKATFGGCDAKNYPIATGTSQVVSVSSSGYRLASGHEVVYGPCSKSSTCKVGDFVSYNGYFVNGVVNALRIERVLLS